MGNKIIVLINEINKGDDAAAFANAEATKCAGDEIIPVKTFDPEQLKLAESIVRENDKTIVIGAGEHMFTHLSEFKILNNNTLTVFSSHQIPQRIAEHVPNLDLLAFPKHVLNTESRNFFAEKLIETIGVAHSTNKENLHSEYQKRVKDFNDLPAVDQKILLLILGGDAPTEEGKYKFYSEENAANDAKIAAEIAAKNGLFLVITNGPRTGSRAQNGEALNNHKEASATDSVSHAALNKLNEIGQQNHHFYDFKFLEKGVNSAYKALLHHAYTVSGSMVFVPGESTSMISECCDVLPPNQIFVTLNDAMNENHKSHVKSVIESGYANQIDSSKSEILELAQTTSIVSNKSAALATGERINNLRSKEPPHEVKSTIGSGLTEPNPLTQYKYKA